MIFDNPDEVMTLVYKGDIDTLSKVGDYLDGLVKRTRINSYFSRGVPGVQHGDWIVFVYYNKNIGFFLKYDNGKTFYSAVEKPSDVFTPNVLNLSNLTTLSIEDAERRAIL